MYEIYIYWKMKLFMFCYCFRKNRDDWKIGTKVRVTATTISFNSLLIPGFTKSGIADFHVLCHPKILHVLVS